MRDKEYRCRVARAQTANSLVASSRSTILHDAVRMLKNSLHRSFKVQVNVETRQWLKRLIRYVTWKRRYIRFESSIYRYRYWLEGATLRVVIVKIYVFDKEFCLARCGHCYSCHLSGHDATRSWIKLFEISALTDIKCNLLYSERCISLFLNYQSFLI